LWPHDIHFGPFETNAYGILTALGVIAGVVALRWTAPAAGIPPGLAKNFAIFMVFVGLLGARFFYVLFHFGFYASEPLRIFKFWQGGLTFHGGLVSCLVVGFATLRVKQVSFSRMGDALAPALSLGQAVGRLGCLLEGCCHGKISNLPFTMVFPKGSSAPAGIPLYPTQAMESLGLFVLTAVLFWFLRKKPGPEGRVLGLYLLGAGLLRFALEFSRGDDRGPLIFGYPPTTHAALILALFGLFFVIGLRGRGRNR
jgi:phosphatidylglycerol:prolipoprotein diacylglycerol transferase